MSCFFNDTATTEIYTLSLRDALPISDGGPAQRQVRARLRRRRRRLVPEVRVRAQPQRDGPAAPGRRAVVRTRARRPARSEEHTSELQSRQYLVCRLLLEKKNYRLFYI